MSSVSLAAAEGTSIPSDNVFSYLPKTLLCFTSELFSQRPHFTSK
jgi:hypothetical protein